MLWFFFLGFFLSSAIANQATINAALDVLLHLTNEISFQGGLNKYDLNDLAQPFEFSFFGRKFSGEFQASEGKVKGFTTAHRVNNVDAIYGTGKRLLTVTFGFEPLEFSYKTYQFKYLSLSANGGLLIKETGSYGIIRLSLTHTNSSCKAAVESVDIETFGTGGEFDQIQVPEQFVPFIHSWVLNDFRNHSKEKIETNMLNALQQSLLKFDLCNIKFE